MIADTNMRDSGTDYPVRLWVSDQRIFPQLQNQATVELLYSA